MIHHHLSRLALSSSLSLAALLLAAPDPALSQVEVDKTCASCGRRQLDSLNLKPRGIRVNQVGYLPDDPRKRAFVANAKAQTFALIDADTRRSVYQGNLTPLGNSSEGGMYVRGNFNSINTLYEMRRASANVALSLADFSAWKTPGRYFIASGTDTSSTFALDPLVYNQVFGTTLKFFGAQRCGATHSWFHKDCHLKDGSALGPAFTGALAGGWHDCGDHGKYSETVAYAAVVLSMAYAYWPQKGEDLYGSSYNDTLPFGTDGIPDVLNEAKVGADYILKLYKASVANGLMAKGDMYHSVGSGPGMDHQYWDVPENQEAQPLNKGGPDRPVTAAIGSNVAGMFASALAFFAWGWEPFNPAYAKECLAAAKDIYAKIVVARKGTTTTNPCCYPGGGPTKDDEALAAFALWFATKDPAYRFDLLDNPALGQSANAKFNQGEFPTGILANTPFHHGGWTTDYENTHVFTLYGLAKLIAGNPQRAAEYGLTQAVADSLKQDCIAALYSSIRIGSNGGTYVTPGISAAPPYNGIFTSVGWGYNRYNFGLVLELFLYWDLTGDKDYYAYGIDNINYNLGMNPWDISFIMGAGDKNLQHPHNRAANPEGYNAGGFPYPYRTPEGALMGGCRPDTTLVDDWEKYDNTETCIDFSSQVVIPLQMLAADLPEDKEGPKFRNVNVIPEDVRAIVSWTTDELSRDTLYLLDGPGGRVLQTVSPDTLARNKQITLVNLTPSTTYYFWFKGVDIRRNSTEDKNGGGYYRFTTLAGPKAAAQITGVKVCNETHEKATVTWWTRNGLYDSRVDYDSASKAGKPAKVKQPDDTGLPTVFHAVTLDGLTPATPYKYSVTSGATTDDSLGNYYRFKTSQVLVDYTIRVKPTNKASNGQGFQAYIDISNNEQKAYTGVELRFYFTADATLAAGLTAKGFDHQLRGVGGSNIGIDIAFGTDNDGKPRQVPGFTDQWYFPIVIKSTLPVAGRASIDLQIFTETAWTHLPFSAMANAWSVRPHASPPDPVAFAGLDLAKGQNGVYTSPEPIETINGEKVVTYVDDPYISAYYEGVHVFGYGPDFKTDVVEKERQAELTLTAPVISPVDKIDIRQEQKPNIMLAGKASVAPDGIIDEVWVNGNPLPASDIAKAADGSASFSFPVQVNEGTNFVDVVAFDTVHCVFAARKIAVNWIKAPPPPPDTVKAVAANPASKTSRDPLSVSLSTPTSGASIWYTLDGKDPQPGQAGTLEYKAPISITEAAVTLKAMATKAGLVPSPVITEQYGVLPYRLAGITTAWLRDRDVDGYADALVLVLDLSEGPLDLALALAQLQSAKFTGSFVLDPAALVAALAPAADGKPSGLVGDSLALPLAANTLPVANGRAQMTLTLPSAPADGLLAPGAYPLRDGIAPVLRSAILHRHDPASPAGPDTLVVVFSEPVSGALPQGRLFSAWDISAGMEYAVTVASGSPRPAVQVRAGEVALGFPVTGMAYPGSQPAVAEAGDSVWIHPSGGIADTAGQAQGHPGNKRVTLRIALPLNIKVGPLDADGFTEIDMPGPQDPTWSVVASGGGEIGAPGGSRLAVRDLTTDTKRFGGLQIDATSPFSLSLRVFSNLGQTVAQLPLVIDEGDFARLPANTDGSRRLSLLWNGRATHGQMAGTGAYIYAWSLNSTDADGRAVARSDRKIYGLLRSGR